MEVVMLRPPMSYNILAHANVKAMQLNLEQVFIHVCKIHQSALCVKHDSRLTCEHRPHCRLSDCQVTVKMKNTAYFLKLHLVWAGHVNNSAVCVLLV